MHEMEVTRNNQVCESDPVKQINSGSIIYKRNVRSQSYSAPSPSSVLHRPQMRPHNEGSNIIDLTSDKPCPPPMRKSKSTITKPSSSLPEHSKGRRFSKYLSKHRLSVSGISSDSADWKENSKALLKKHLKADNLQLCHEEVETVADVSCSESPARLSTSSSDTFNSASYRRNSSKSSVFDRRSSDDSKEKSGSSSTSPEAVLTDKFFPTNSTMIKGKPYVQYKSDSGEWEKYNLQHTRSSLYYAEKFDLTCKVVLLGDSGVGKTCLLMKFKDGAFLSGSYISTVGIDFRNKVVNVDDAKVKLQIWDTAGQERFRSVTHAYYRDAHALLLLYDITSKISFDNTRAWLAEVHEYAQDDVVIMLIGNKCDSATSERQVRKEDGERLAREYNVTFMETSAKTGLNVDLAFTAVARDLKSKKSESKYEKKFNVSEYVQREAKTDQCICSVG